MSFLKEIKFTGEEEVLLQKQQRTAAKLSSPSWSSKLQQLQVLAQIAATTNKISCTRLRAGKRRCYQTLRLRKFGSWKCSLNKIFSDTKISSPGKQKNTFYEHYLPWQGLPSSIQLSEQFLMRSFPKTPSFLY